MVSIARLLKGLTVTLAFFTVTGASCRSLASPTPRDASALPFRAFAYIVAQTDYVAASCKAADATCPLTRQSVHYASGFFIERSKVSADTAFVMTAKHQCDHRKPAELKGQRPIKSRLIVTDWKMREHEANFYFESHDADVCVITVKDAQPDISLVAFAHSMPVPGERVYTLSSPGGFFAVSHLPVPFEGLWAGLDTDGDPVMTIPTAPGSSGAAVFDQSGRVVSLAMSIPLHETTRDGKSVAVPVLDSLAYGVPLPWLREAFISVVTMDDVFGTTLLPHAPGEPHSIAP